MEHALGDRDDVTGIDHPSSAENSALQDIDRKVVRGSSGSVHVELIVHRAIALGSLRSDEITPFLEHDDLMARLGQKARCSCTAAARADDADLGRNRFGRGLLRQIGDPTGHGVTPCVRFIDGPG